MSAIELSGVSKRFGDVRPIGDFSLSIEPGTLSVLVGPSGCGKTTLLRLIAGLEVPETGRITLGGRVVTGDGIYAPPNARDVGFAFQDFALWPHKNVAAHLEFVLRARGLRRGKRLEEIETLLEVVELADKRRAYPATLSGGQQQRLAIARALAGEPRILLLDEPFANLDTRLRERILTEIVRRRAFGVTVLIATHDLDDIEASADRVVRMVTA